MWSRSGNRVMGRKRPDDASKTSEFADAKCDVRITSTLVNGRTRLSNVCL